MDPDIPGHPSSHYLVSESLRVEMLSALVFLKITKINWLQLFSEYNEGLLVIIVIQSVSHV